MKSWTNSISNCTVISNWLTVSTSTCTYCIAGNSDKSYIFGDLFKIFQLAGFYIGDCAIEHAQNETKMADYILAVVHWTTNLPVVQYSINSAHYLSQLGANSKNYTKFLVYIVVVLINIFLFPLT